ncbi:N-6 DNA methylase [Kitasatospora sp. NPDC056783]|uniref:N-6 DNA methylase n=1 Tax=Kitasatospora sp. NPDC056783 TaxID=3345943 RepID=UPI0036B94F17
MPNLALSPAEVARLPLFQSARARRMLMPEDGADHARTIADTVRDAWLTTNGGAGIEVAIGTTAILAILPVIDPDAAALAGRIAALSPATVTELLDRAWQRLWWQQPDIVDRARPLRAWLDAPQAWQQHGALVAAQTCIRTGLLELASDHERAVSGDVLGRLLQQLRGHADKQSRGEFHTPAGVTDFMAEVFDVAGTVTDWSIGEPAAGSGAMWRAIARHMVTAGEDPAKKCWIGAEIDPLAAAVLAANSVIWRLGPDVLIAAADALATRDSGLGRAAEERAASFARRDAALVLVREATGRPGHP